MNKMVFLLVMFISIGYGQEQIDQKVYQKALNLLETTISIDSHSDTPLRLRDTTLDIGKRNTRGCFDFVRMKEGKLTVEFFAVFVGNNDDKNNPSKIALDIIQKIYKMMDKNKDIAALAFSTRQLEINEITEKKVICLGLENGGPLEGDLGNLDMFYNLGIRYITLTHSGNNDICESASDTAKIWNGLSPFGKKVVQKMNELGIMIDVSHISDKSFWDVIELTKAPIIASHSCCRAICNSPRNLTDEMIKAVAKNGGVVQLNFYPGYISNKYNEKADEISIKIKPSLDSLKKLYKEGGEEYRREYLKIRKRFPNSALPDVSVLIDHIDHIVKLVGADYVGIGSDFDGLSIFPKGLEDVSKLPIITYHLLKRGYSEKDIKKIVGGNFMRVWRKVEQNSTKKSF